jgi:hypothetical protein
MTELPYTGSHFLKVPPVEHHMLRNSRDPGNVGEKKQL